MGATEYINLPGGVDLYSESEFTKKGVNLTIRNLPVMKYETSSYQFEPRLSILDVLMWNSPGVVFDFLNRHKDAK